MRHPVLLACCMLGAVHLLRAAPPKPPVAWQVRPVKPVKAEARFQVFLTGTIDPGWRLYALEEPDGGPIATVIALADGDPADLERVTEGKPKVVPDPAFGLSTGYFAGTATFTLQLAMTRGAKAGDHPLHVLVRYQSCNDRVCLPPRTDIVSVPVTVKP